MEFTLVLLRLVLPHLEALLVVAFQVEEVLLVAEVPQEDFNHNYRNKMNSCSFFYYLGKIKIKYHIV